MTERNRHDPAAASPADDGTAADGRRDAATPSGDIEFDARVVAPCLGLSPEAFMDELKRGIVYQTTERGVGDDAGRYRVTFRYRARRCRVIVQPGEGTVSAG